MSEPLCELVLLELVDTGRITCLDVDFGLTLLLAIKPDGDTIGFDDVASALLLGALAAVEWDDMT